MGCTHSRALSLLRGSVVLSQASSTAVARSIDPPSSRASTGPTVRFTHVVVVADGVVVGGAAVAEGDFW